MSLSKKPSSNLASSILSTLPPIAPSLGSAPQPTDHQQQEPQINNITNKKIPQTIKLGSRLIFTSKRPQSWSWKPFSSSARKDDAQFSHWVRSNAEYPDYPYARFDVSLDRLVIQEDEWGLLDEEWGVINDEKTASSGGKSKTVAQKLIKKTPPKIPKWTREETETLLTLAHQYELRWPVIIDRWRERFNMLPDGTLDKLSVMRTVEDLQYRYYHVGNVLARKRLEGAVAEIGNQKPTSIAAAAGNPVDAKANKSASTGKEDPKQSPSQLDSSEKEALKNLSQNLAVHPSLVPNISIPNTGTSLNTKPFDLLAEKSRRAYLHYVWNRPKSEEKEEEELKAELRVIELQLRKMKKSGKFMVPKGSVHSVSAAAAKAETKTVAERKAEMDAYVATTKNLTASFTATAPVPTSGTPYLQSGRLFPPALGGGLNKSTLKQMDEILAELKVTEPIATKRACDLYDAVRKDTLTLLILQKIVLRKEAEVMSKRGKLVNAMGAGNGEAVVLEGKPETKKRKMSDADKVSAPASTTGATKKAKSTGKQLSVGKKLPNAEQLKVKPKKVNAPALPLTGASASATASSANSSSTSGLTPLNTGKGGVSTKSPPPAKTGKKRGRPAKNPPAAAAAAPASISPSVPTGGTEAEITGNAHKKAKKSS